MCSLSAISEHHLGSALLHIFPEFGPHLCYYTHMPIPCIQCAFVCIQYRCGMQSKDLCILSHFSATSFRLSHTTFSPECGPHLPKEVLLCKGALMCPFTAYQGVKTLGMHPIDVGCSLGLCFHHDSTASFGLTAHPFPHISPEIGPHLHKCYSVRVHPYADPLHINMLKQFINIKFGCRL